MRWLILPTSFLLTFGLVRTYRPSAKLPDHRGVEAQIEPTSATKADLTLRSLTDQQAGSATSAVPAPKRPLFLARMETRQDLSDLERELLEPGTRRRRDFYTLKHIVEATLTSIATKAKSTCERMGHVPTMNGEQPAFDTGFLISANTKSEGQHLVLSDVSVEPWKGAAVTESFLSCVRNFAGASLFDTASSWKPPFGEYPRFSGRHRVIVGLSTTCHSQVK
jgi:hypothetical protein